LKVKNSAGMVMEATRLGYLSWNVNSIFNA
jgi:hypothetical protein